MFYIIVWFYLMQRWLAICYQ
uniref:Uncharacterized protein n=1 Tax=Anguilla anguilla TaxID=7936 RepID=A0A0E9VV86_ANGAN